MSKLPVAIIGGGPVGLAAASHLTVRGESFLLFEKGDEIAANIRSWEHVRVFSPWKYNIDKSAQALLEASGWVAPDLEGLPTGGELIANYLKPLAALPALSSSIHYNANVISVSRHQLDRVKSAGREGQPFELRIQNGTGEITTFLARAVIDASGTWQHPNPAGANGLAAIGEADVADKVFYGIPKILKNDRTRYAGKRVMVIGGGHSAMNALLELVELQEIVPDTEIIWVLRSGLPAQASGIDNNDALPARGALGTRLHALVNEGRIRVASGFRVEQMNRVNGTISVVAAGNVPGIAGPQLDGLDEIIVATGLRPDFSMLRELRIDVDPLLESVPTLAPLIDPNVHSCGSVPPHGEAELRHTEKDFYIVGMKSYGRAPTFLLATGYEQVRSIVAGLCNDWEAAREVKLVLPETGVCKSDTVGDACCDNDTRESETEAACCGTSCCGGDEKVTEEQHAEA